MRFFRVHAGLYTNEEYGRELQMTEDDPADLYEVTRLLLLRFNEDYKGKEFLVVSRVQKIKSSIFHEGYFLVFNPESMREQKLAIKTPRGAEIYPRAFWSVFGGVNLYQGLWEGIEFGPKPVCPQTSSLQCPTEDQCQPFNNVERMISSWRFYRKELQDMNERLVRGSGYAYVDD